MKITKALGLLLLALLLEPKWAPADAAQDDVDQLLMLQEQQTESVDTLDTQIENTVYARGVTRTLQSRLVVDKTQGLLKLEQYNPLGEISATVLIQGPEVYVHGRQGHGSWMKLPMDAQTQSTLEAMGIQFGANSAGGVAGLEKSDGAALEAASSPAPSAQDMALDLSGTPEAELPLLRRHGWKKAQLAKALARVRRRLARRKKKQSFERLAAADSQDGRLRVLRCRHDPSNPNRPWDEELLKVDAQSGKAMEKTQFIKASRWPGGMDKLPKGAKRMQQLVPGVAAPTDPGDELVELGHSTVIHTQEIHGAVVTQESESFSNAQLGAVRLHTLWKQTKVNEKVDKSEFERRN